MGYCVYSYELQIKKKTWLKFFFNHKYNYIIIIVISLISIFK